MPEVITNHLDLWTSALLTKSSVGRGGNGKLEAYGIKKLRELILELAVRGKLVPQDPNDEPASVLLEKILKEKTLLIKAGKIKKERPLPEITDDDRPYILPSGWEWERLGNIFDIQDSRRIPVNSADRASREGSYPYYGANGQVGVIDDYLFDGERILVAEDGGFFDDPIRGVAYAVNGKFWVNNHAHVLECLCATSTKYWVSYLNRVDWVPLVRGMTRDKLNQAAMIQIVMAIPPLAEQHRIVAKVDELMALCDQLERQQTDSLAAHQTMVETLLGTLTQPAVRAELVEARPSTVRPFVKLRAHGSGRTDFEEAWARIASHFDTLFTTEASIDQLKQTVLQLAVMGKLVPQDPNDEPAGALLTRIAGAREQVIVEGKAKRQMDVLKMDGQDIPFPLPENWAWTRFENLINPEFPLSYGVLVPGPDVDGGVPFVRIEDLDINNPPEKPAKSIAEDIDVKYERTRLMGGEILMGVVGSIGKLGVAPNSWKGANIARAVCRIMPTDSVNKQFVVWLLQSEFMQVGFLGDTRTLAQPTLNIGLIRAAPTPLPPLTEQHRIVAKVDELMALCDALKARLADAQTTQLHLADAIVEQAVA